MPKGQYSRRPCEPGCDCGRHKGSAARTCPPGCTCGRHQVSQTTRTNQSHSQLQYWSGPDSRREATARFHSTRVRSEEERARLSLSMRQAVLSGYEPSKNGSWSASPGYHNGVYMRCLNSEGVFARQLDRADIRWIYEPRRFDLGWTTYLPDFYLPEFDIWIEVKGWVTPEAQAKINAFRDTGRTLTLVLQDELEGYSYGVQEVYDCREGSSR